MDRARRRVGLKHQRRTVLMLVGAAVVATFSLLPIYFIFTVSITADSDVIAGVRPLWPAHPTLANYFNLFTIFPYGSFLRNSIIVSVATTLASLLLAVPAAYAFARLRFRGRRAILLSVLMLYMVPPVVLIVPLLIIFRTLQLYNTYGALVLADISLVLPFGVWLLVGFFATIPRELEEAALVDGCSRVGAMIRIALPLAMPGIITAAVIFFIITWNEFLFAYTFASSADVKPLPAALRGFVFGEAGVFWGTAMASAVVTSLPVAALFLLFQKRLIPGLASGGVKG